MNSFFNLIRTYWIRFVSESLWLLERVMFYPKLARSISKSSLVIENSVIFDVGANRGQSIRFFLKLFPQCTIYGFEPSRSVFPILRDKFSGNPNIKLFELALGSASGKSVFFEHPLDETSTLSPPDSNSNWQKTKNRLLFIGKDHQFIQTIVTVTTVDEFYESNNLSKIDLLKIDVEGFEYDVLRGATNTLTKGAIRTIQIERHVDDLRLDRTSEIRDFLKAFGFETRISIKHSFGSFYEDLYAKKADQDSPF